MDLEIEIPIWYNGRMKWISNLNSRSTCYDVIQAILSTDENHVYQSNDEYVLYECWRGVERPLKPRCRLLKLWNSWAGESQNVILTLRNHKHCSTSTQLLIRQQDKKLEKLKRQIKRADRQIEKFTTLEQNNNQSMLGYINLYRCIIHTQNQLEYQQKLISCLISDIENEMQNDMNHDDLTNILHDVNETLIISRKLTEQSEELDQQIYKTNEEIDQKQYLLDELELDDALDQNIDLDSLNNEEYDEEYQETSQSSISLKQERATTKEILPLIPSSITQKVQIVPPRPTAIVEPNLLINKSNGIIDLASKSRISTIPISIHYHSPWSLSTNDESDTGISSFNSNDDQLVTLV